MMKNHIYTSNHNYKKKYNSINDTYINNQKDYDINRNYKNKYYIANSVNTMCSTETLKKSYKSNQSDKDYFSLYYKYKNKYLQLKNILGGNPKTAKNFFYSFLKKNSNILETLYQNDRYFKKLLDEIKINITETDKIFEIIIERIHDNHVDDFIKIYLTQQLGSPNSLENKGRFLDASEKLDLLRRNKKNLGIPTIQANFESLTQLENFITENKENLEKIEEKKRLRESKNEKHKKKKKKVKMM